MQVNIIVTLTITLVSAAKLAIIVQTTKYFNYNFATNSDCQYNFAIPLLFIPYYIYAHTHKARISPTKQKLCFYGAHIGRHGIPAVQISISKPENRTARRMTCLLNTLFLYLLRHAAQLLIPLLTEAVYQWFTQETVQGHIELPAFLHRVATHLPTVICQCCYAVA